MKYVIARAHPSCADDFFLALSNSRNTSFLFQYRFSEMQAIGTRQGLLGGFLLFRHLRRTLQLEASTPQTDWDRFTGTGERPRHLGTDRQISLTHTV